MHRNDLAARTNNQNLVVGATEANRIANTYRDQLIRRISNTKHFLNSVERLGNPMNWTESDVEKFIDNKFKHKYGYVMLRNARIMERGKPLSDSQILSKARMIQRGEGGASGYSSGVRSAKQRRALNARKNK